MDAASCLLVGPPFRRLCFQCKEQWQRVEEEGLGGWIPLQPLAFVLGPGLSLDKSLEAPSGA